MLDEKRQHPEEAYDNFLEYEEDLRALYINILPLKKEESLDYAKARAHIVFSKYCKIFEDDAHMRRGRKQFLACKVFDILYICTLTDHFMLDMMIYDLINFEFLALMI